MNRNPDQKEQTRRRILAAAHRGFRRNGFAGAGVDGLADEAGVTSGAFYKHFGSKAGAFRAAVDVGVGEFNDAVRMFRERHGEDWLARFAEFYLGEKRCAAMDDSCALQSLTPEVMRADEDTRAVFQAALERAANTFTEGLPAAPEAERDQTWAAIAMLIGGATLARAVKDPDLADEIAAAVSAAVPKTTRCD